jgi:hypothetical protein
MEIVQFGLERRQNPVVILSNRVQKTLVRGGVSSAARESQKQK